LDPKNFKNLIFDFGGVIINIDPDRTVRKFQKLGPNLSSEDAMIVIKDPLFGEFEKGHIGEEDLRFRICRLLNLDPKEVSNDAFDDAWNGMILDLPESRLHLLENLSKTHRIFLLSNTNSIHMRYVSKVVKRTIQKDSIDHLFEKAYYSFNMGMRKPDREIYDQVLNDNNLIASETLFLDDSPVNFSGAIEAGISTLEVNRDILEIFS